MREARKNSGWSQEALGDAMSITKGNVSAWENNRHQPSIPQLLKISQLTGHPLPSELGNLNRISEDKARQNGAACERIEMGISAKAFQVAKAYDALTNPAQKAAVIAQLEAFGVL